MLQQTIWNTGKKGELIFNGLDGVYQFDLEAWDRKLEDVAQACSRLTDETMWEIGYLLLEGEEDGQLTEKELKRHAEKAVKRSWKTMRNWKVVCKAFYPPSRRRDGLPFSVHEVVAQFEPERQGELLDIASNGKPGSGKPLSVRELEAEVKRLYPKTDTGNGNGKADPDLRTIKIQATLNVKDYDFLRQVAFLEYGNHDKVGVLIVDTAIKHFEDNFEDLKSKIEKHKTKRKADEEMRGREVRAALKEQAEFDEIEDAELEKITAEHQKSEQQ